MNRLLFTLLSLMLYSELQGAVEGSTAQQRENVISFLRRKSHRLVRPDGEGGGETPVVVNIQYSTIRLLELEADGMALRSTGYLFVTWTDRRLRFRQMASYRGAPLNVSSVRMDVNMIWTPDIELYNGDTPGMNKLTRNDMAVVFSSGTVSWVPAVGFSSFCEPLFQNGTLTCIISFGSWTYSENDIDLQNRDEMDILSSKPRGPWTLVSSSVQRVGKVYPCCPETYVTIEYTFNFVRQNEN